MNQASVEKRVTRLLAGALALDEASLHLELALFDELAIGSQMLVELMVAIEDEFAIALPSLDRATPRTIGDLVAMVLEQRR